MLPLPPRHPVDRPPDWRERQAEGVRRLLEWAKSGDAEADERGLSALEALDRELEAERLAALERDRIPDESAA